MSSNKLEDQFVNYDIVLQLKELGFDEDCFARYEGKIINVEKPIIFEFTFANLPRVDNKVGYPNYPYQDVEAPLISQVFDWFETEHKLFSSIRIGLGSPIWYDYMIQSIDGRTIQISECGMCGIGGTYELEESSVYVEEDESFETKREAQIACILKLIELVKTK